MAKKLEMPKEELQKLVDYGFTQDQMAEYFDCSTPTIKTRMKEYEIEPSGGSANLGKIVMDLEEEIDEIKDSLKNKQESKIEIKESQKTELVEPKKEIVSIKISSEYHNYSIDKNDIVLYNNLNDIYVHANEAIEIATGVYLDIPENYQIQSYIIFDNRNLYGTCILSEKNEIIVILNNYHTVDHYELAKNSAIAKIFIVKKADVNWIE